MKNWVLLAGLGLAVTGAMAETLEQKVERMDKEIQTLKAGGGSGAQGPSRVSVGGYGELNYNNFKDGTVKDQFDVRRFVLYFGYQFSDSIKLVSELEFEHGFFDKDKGSGELAMEQLYLQFGITEGLNIRAGLLLPPIGFINEYHEPTVFYGVERNEVETRIIPSTWRELGVAAQGNVADGLEYNVGIVTSLDASLHTSAASAVRDYRTKASRASANDFALYAAANYRGIPGLQVGASLFTGNTAQDGRGSIARTALQNVDARLTLWDVHAKYSTHGVDLKALYALGKLGDTEAINAAAGLAAGSNAAAPKSFEGWYVEAAYHVIQQEKHDLAPFVRYERYNTQKEVAAGFTIDPKNDEKVLTFGLSYKPHPQVVIKADHQNFRADNKKDRWNLGIGYMF